MVQVPASYLAQLQEQALQAQQLLAKQAQAPACPEGSKEVWTEASSSHKTVRLDPVILTYYDHARKRGFDSDIGSFLVQCVEYFFHTRGIHVVPIEPF